MNTTKLNRTDIVTDIMPCCAISFINYEFVTFMTYTGHWGQTRRPQYYIDNGFLKVQSFFTL